MEPEPDGVQFEEREALVEELCYNARWNLAWYPREIALILWRHVHSASQVQVDLLREIVKTGIVDIVSLAGHTTVACALPLVLLRAQISQWAMVAGDQKYIVRLHRAGASGRYLEWGEPSVALLDAAAQYVPSIEMVAELWASPSNQRPHGFWCERCQAIARKRVRIQLYCSLE